MVANIIWNVRPSAASVGAAVEVHDGAEAALIERNLIAEATEGVRVAAGARLEALGDEGEPPQGVLVERNVIYNRINPSRFGVVIDHAVGVRLYHNLVYHSRKALMVSDLPPKTQAIRALNNLFLEATSWAFEPAACPCLTASRRMFLVGAWAPSPPRLAMSAAASPSRSLTKRLRASSPSRRSPLRTTI